RNAAADDDDLDYMIVTTQHRVWLARAFAILVVRLVRLRGAVICPNYVVAENALEQRRKDLFIAHEIAQMIPIYGHAHYWQLRDTNRWTATHLPNAQSPFYDEADRDSHGFWAGMKALGEALLGGKLGDWLEQWEYQRKAERIRREMQRPDSAAQIDRDNVKGHFR